MSRFRTWPECFAPERFLYLDVFPPFIKNLTLTEIKHSTYMKEQTHL